ncbi:MAG: haloacid dehalogenase type II [Ktedonobacterales bacterium]
MPRICVFDVNETLLDLSALDPDFQRIFGAPGVRREWFKQVLQSSMVATMTGAYADFAAIGAAALEMTAARHGLTLADDDKQSILGGMRRLPPHPDVREGLERLRAAGLRLATLTNSPPPVVDAQLANAGLRDYFEQVLSVDTVKRYKPAAEVYQMAARSLGVEIGQIRLIAAHDWDTTGALRAGCAAAFVARPGQTLDPLAPRPDIVANDLLGVADLIIEREGTIH